ncbi:MAG: histidine kinase [Bacteroidales bacterium]|nr:histidine kinase [Bacteroidales bacterium]
MHSKNKRLILRLAQVGADILAYSVFIEICIHLIIYNQFRIYDNWKHEIFNHLANILPIFIITLLSVLVVFMITDRGKLGKRYTWKLLVDIAVSLGITFGIYSIFWWYYRKITMGIEVNYGSILALHLITILIIEIIYYVQYTKGVENKAEQAKLLALQYQYDAFRAQVNPHFLFNSLNILMELIEQDKEKAVEFTDALADIYRHILQTHKKDRISVTEELEFLRSYTNILTLKYLHYLEVNIQVDYTKPKYIIPFTTQILMENITKHNIISASQPMQVHIRVNDEGISIQNPIQRKINNRTNTGLGLQYISTQYASNNKELIVQDDGQTFTAIIPYL